jgi:hypothetical protein
MEPVLARGTVKLRNFDSRALISVERINNSVFEGIVGNAMFIAGFKVISNEVAKFSLNISNT